VSGVSRRAFLGAMGSALALAGIGCSPVITRLERPAFPEGYREYTPLAGTERDPVVHLLNRATYGPRPNQVAAVRQLGPRQWLESQLYPRNKDAGLGQRLRRLDTLNMTAADLLSFSRRPDKRMLADQLAVATLLRAVFSENQLFEVMVGFWTDHFSIYHAKKTVPNLKTVDDRDVIRTHALGTFGGLLRASAHSPAMLVYLDNVENEKSHPNENYAREIMELHTLGVDGGYTERDIQAVARCFTGWTVSDSGAFVFIPEWHDQGEKQVLGHTIPAGGGQQDGERVLDILLAHPSTPRFVCTKLARRFVADDPPADLIQAMVSTWRNDTVRDQNGQIPAVLRTMFTHPRFLDAPPKFKRPFALLASMLRATNANYSGHPVLLARLADMGHRPFNHPTPDGYPDTAQAWTGDLLGRWNLAIDLVTGQLPGIRIDTSPFIERARASADPLGFLNAALVRQPLTAQMRQTITDFAAGAADDDEWMLRAMGGLLASPAFQWR
jgi:hypothetical protein